MIFAALTNNNKKRRAHSITLLSQLPEGMIPRLAEIFQAHKNKNSSEVNRIVSTTDANHLNNFFELIKPENRPKYTSAGKLGDNLAWITLEKTLNEQGYTENAAKIITGIIVFNLDSVLNTVIQKQAKST